MYRVLVRMHVGEAIVRPPFEFLKRRDKLTVKNSTTDKITVTVPDVFDEKDFRRVTSGLEFTVKAGKKLDLTIRNDAPLGVYSFRIFCCETNSYAQANSDAEFIVE